MNQIRNYVEAMFSNLPKIREVIDMKMTMLENMEEKFQELLKEGKNENEAVGIVLADFGNMEELKEELGIKDTTLGNTDTDYISQENPALQEELLAFKKQYALAIAIACILFIMSPAVFISMQSIFASDSPLPYLGLFSLIACGAAICIYFRIQNHKYRRQYNTTDDAETNTSKGIESIIFSSATVIFLCMGFLFNLWHPGWIIFIVAAIISRTIRLFNGPK
ncbi:permease prefix domain 1-containing protein [Aminipila terrae]|uniref:Uncharacterized protein n=1 Tax=Aminipila terrae TaxID=2697030 RepID=A0A6P1MIY6_9FIRM|nr:permease prefix domain 1-containing protein [Aminipila terrae]QHI72574.1 hypothetical protein Ami3637_09335 [Aminipila terrae]